MIYLFYSYFMYIFLECNLHCQRLSTMDCVLKLELQQKKISEGKWLTLPWYPEPNNWRTARPWIPRCQQKGWPMNTTTSISTIVKSGVHIVPIGSSPNENLEWRISFTKAEQKLVYSFNHCQFLCYGLLKIFMMEVINARRKTHVLCLYLIKTVIIWVIQNDSSLIRTPDIWYIVSGTVWNCWFTGSILDTVQTFSFHRTICLDWEWQGIHSMSYSNNWKDDIAEG